MPTFLAVFDEGTARAPIFLESPGPEEHICRNVLDEQQNVAIAEACARTLADAYGHCQPASRKLVRLSSKLVQMNSGFAVETSSFCQYVCKDGVHAVFAGEVSNWPGIDAVAAAHDAFVRGELDSGKDEAAWLIAYYNTFKDATTRDVTDAVLAALAQVCGSFAFVLYDEELQRVMVARDRDGATTLHWGAAPDGRFLLGTCAEDLHGCSPSATLFPAGSLYASDGPNCMVYPGDHGFILPREPQHGALFSFVESAVPGQRWREMKAVPRLTQEGTLCGAVYKVASEANIVQNLAGC